MTSASALILNCGYPRLLNRTLPKSTKSQAACDLGTMFHSAIEGWAKGSPYADVPNDEVRGWLELLAMTWSPQEGMHFELALGLGPGGNAVTVEEYEPHKYRALDSSPLLTAGRADLVWLTQQEDGARIAHVKDWKTGKYPAAPARENLQLSALALAAADAFACDGFIREIYYARDGYLDADPAAVMLDSAEAAEAWERVERAALLDETPRPGAHCEPCWERRMKRCIYAQAADT